MNLSMKKRLEGTPAQNRAFVISMMVTKILIEQRAAKEQMLRETLAARDAAIGQFDNILD